MRKNTAFLILSSALAIAAYGEDFLNPGKDSRPQTWFHLIGGNVSKNGLTLDLESVAGAGISGIQLFHGSGGVWPRTGEQIQ